MVLNFRIKKKKKHNIKNKKLNCSLHTKKTNNTNKLPFYPYKNSKITKLKKKKKKSFFLVLASTPKICLYAKYMASLLGL